MGKPSPATSVFQNPGHETRPPPGLPSIQRRGGGENQFSCWSWLFSTRYIGIEEVFIQDIFSISPGDQEGTALSSLLTILYEEDQEDYLNSLPNEDIPVLEDWDLFSLTVSGSQAVSLRKHLHALALLHPMSENVEKTCFQILSRMHELHQADGSRIKGFIPLLDLINTPLNPNIECSSSFTLPKRISCKANRAIQPEELFVQYPALCASSMYLQYGFVLDTTNICYKDTHTYPKLAYFKDLSSVSQVASILFQEKLYWIKQLLEKSQEYPGFGFRWEGWA